jgi:hypothetical protein
LLGIIVAFSVALVLVSLVLPFFENVPPVLGAVLIAIAALFLLTLIPVFWVPSRAIVRIEHWWRRFGTATYGVMITAVLVIIAAISYNDPDNASRKLTLLIVIALAGIVPTMTMLGTWKKQREYKAIRTIVPAQSFFDFSPLLRIWFAYTALFLFILPFLLYVFVPGVFHFTFTLITPEDDEPTLAERITNVQNGLEDILVHAPPGSTAMAEEAIADLLAFAEDVPLPVDALSHLTLDQKAGIVLTWMHDLAQNSPAENQQPVLNAITALEQYIETAGLEVSSDAEDVGANLESEEPLPPWITADKAFLRTWFKYVLAASIAALVFGLIAVNGYVRRINRHLPRYLFHSIANMTRVVVWEAIAALEIQAEAALIQWVNVKRNSTGGIKLEGFYRDAVQSARADEIRVNAQRYTISTDKWGHIQSAKVTAVRVPIQPRLPGTDRGAEISQEFFRNLSRASAATRSEHQENTSS